MIEEVKGGGASAPRVSISTDAGLYLCEFTYYRSMHAQVPAVFVHVPPTSESYDAESHADDLRQIVASIVRSYGSSTAAGGGASAGGVSSDQAQEADDGAEDKYIINADDNAWVAFFKKTRASNGDVATAVCAMRTLIEYIRVTEAKTLSELRDGIKDVIVSARTFRLSPLSISYTHLHPSLPTLSFVHPRAFSLVRLCVCI